MGVLALDGKLSPIFTDDVTTQLHSVSSRKLGAAL